jgi:enoyl-CoA hydratase
VALGCDLRIASSDAQLGLPEVKFGIIPDVGGSTRLPAVVGLGRAKELIMTARLIDAAEAERIGLINRVVPAEQLAAEVDALADRLARTPPEVNRLTKQLPNRAMEAGGLREMVAAGLDLGALINAADTPEQREWDAIVRRDGVKAALAWRDQRYEAGRRDPSAGEEPPPA